MRFTCLRWIAYAVALAGPALAQPPTLISREMPRVEMSVGITHLFGGPGRDLERAMSRLGLDHDAAPLKSPRTSPRDFLPVFAQLQVGVAERAMVGVLISGFGISTVGQDADGGRAHVESSIVSRALLVSYRPNPWMKIGAGPALHRRTVEVFGMDGATRGQQLGWLGSAEVKFARRPLTYDRPPAFGYITAQYRGAPALHVPAGSLAVSGLERRAVAWPAHRVRTSHWMIGVGVGFEI